MFGTVRKYSKKRVHFALPRPNVFSVFDNFTESGHPTSLWFEFDTYGRLQEIAIHITSVAEYVLCCARQARMANNSAEETQAAFLKSLDEDIRVCEDENSSGVILLNPNVSTDNMEAEVASQCLQNAIQIAHAAVLKGLARAGRKYGLKRTKSIPRQKVQLWMMRRVFPEVMDTTISALKDTISQIMGGTEEVELGMDMVEVYLTKILREMEKLYPSKGTLTSGTDISWNNSSRR